MPAKSPTVPIVRQGSLMSIVTPSGTIFKKMLGVEMTGKKTDRHGEWYHFRENAWSWDDKRHGSNVRYKKAFCAVVTEARFSAYCLLASMVP